MVWRPAIDFLPLPPLKKKTAPESDQEIPYTHLFQGMVRPRSVDPVELRPASDRLRMADGPHLSIASLDGPIYQDLNLDFATNDDSSSSNSPSESHLDDDMEYDYDLSPGPGLSTSPDLRLLDHPQPSGSSLRSSVQTFTRKSKAGKRHFVTPAGAGTQLI